MPATIDKLYAGSHGVRVHRISHFFVVGQSISGAGKSEIPAEQISGFRQEMLWGTHRKNGYSGDFLCFFLSWQERKKEKYFIKKKLRHPNA